MLSPSKQNSEFKIDVKVQAKGKFTTLVSPFNREVLFVYLFRKCQMTNYRVGFFQNQPTFGDVARNLDEAERAICDMDADLIVLPELFQTGYQFTSKEEAQQLAEPITGSAPGPTTERLTHLAKRKHCFIIAGLAEKEGGSVFNSSVVTGPDGVVGRYRKIHLFDTEKSIFQPGREAPPVFQLGAARVGVMICFDWRFPETARSLALQEADLIAHPSNLVLPHCPQSMITRCLENRVFAVTVDRVGSESRIPGETLRFIGQSQVVDPDGQVMIRASEDQPQTEVVEIDLEKARNKAINPSNDLFEDRHPDLYFSS